MISSDFHFSHNAMPYDDDADPTAVPPVSAAAHGDAPTHENAEDQDGDDVVSDFRKFASALPGGSDAAQKKKTPHVSGKTLRRGEKDFESHGTRLQENTLESSRTAMHDVLSYTRVHAPGNYMVGWYFPEHFATEPDEEAQPLGLWKRDRVVVLEKESGPMVKSMGRVLKGQAKTTPAWDKTWLLPEEALFLVERGDLLLRWPQRGIEEIFPVAREAAGETAEKEERTGDDNYEWGVPLSLQAAYALFIGNEDDRGKVTLEKYQVYSNLRRSGYLVSRATPLNERPTDPPATTLWQWLVSLVMPSSSTSTPDMPRNHPPSGPLVKPGLYHSYQPIYHQLHLIPRHRPSPAPSQPPPEEPFKVFYHVFKSRPGFTKSKLPVPDFRIAVVDARTTSVPTLSEMASLVDSTPYDPPDPKSGAGGPGIGHMYQRLKHGWRNVIVAVVDGGMTSYLRFTEMAFGEERLHERFDAKANPGSKKSGGRGQKGGRGGGRGGRGRGRGGGRGR